MLADRLMRRLRPHISYRVSYSIGGSTFTIPVVQGMGSTLLNRSRCAGVNYEFKD